MGRRRIWENPKADGLQWRATRSASCVKINAAAATDAQMEGEGKNDRRTGARSDRRELGSSERTEGKRGDRPKDRQITYEVEAI